MSENGWRRNPLVGAVAGVVVFLMLAVVVSRLACGRGGRDPLAGSSVTLICPHDGTVFRVAREELGLAPDADPDQVAARIGDVACPECGEKDCVMPVYCRSCGEPFAPPTHTTSGQDFQCPHCGESPWGR
ncbi:MAG: hypothetical protein ACODAJ_02770 [Planctomycetota bacterium]